MQFGLVLATLLCFTTWMNLVHAVTGPVQNCPCLRWSPTQIHVDKILNYTIQREGICSITAIMFQTVRGKTICSDPETKWTKKAMQKVDSKAKPKVVEKIQKEEGSASEMTPAVSSAPTKSPQRTSRIVKRLKKRSRKMRQWQRSRA